MYITFREALAEFGRGSTEQCCKGTDGLGGDSVKWFQQIENETNLVAETWILSKLSGRQCSAALCPRSPIAFRRFWIGKFSGNEWVKRIEMGLGNYEKNTRLRRRSSSHEIQLPFNWEKEVVHSFLLLLCLRDIRRKETFGAFTLSFPTEEVVIVSARSRGWVIRIETRRASSRNHAAGHRSEQAVEMRLNAKPSKNRIFSVARPINQPTNE